MQASEDVDEPMLHLVDLSDRQVIRHLLGETLEQVTVAGHRLLEGIHHLGADQVLRWDHIFQVELQRFLQNVPLRLAVTLGERDELFVELGIDLGCELLRGCIGKRPLDSILADSKPRIKANLDLSISLHKALCYMSGATVRRIAVGPLCLRA